MMQSDLGAFLAQLAAPEKPKQPDADDYYSYLQWLTRGPQASNGGGGAGKQTGMNGIGTALASGLGIGAKAAPATTLASGTGLGALAAL